MKFTILLLTILMLAPLAGLNAKETTGTQLDSVPYTGGQEGYACYRCPTLAVSASVGILYERGDLDDAARKAERYDEVGFTVVPFAGILTPLPSVSGKGALNDDGCV